ncbi:MULTISPECIES: aspartate kinase [Thermodesulfobacterium]|jgi:aspartate kinase|uniref:Aspartokinase n=2 Tax=Thermodesulfobacterium commune TaxID=1741 RepID=A0A075WTC3_9BACT|nr:MULTISPECIES: aspartate kinase [Thermodesulfobacterium]KUJ97663.1 MAG: Aspartokinase [Thermodesulfobacterium sp. 37_54]KUK19447.1 MAG: Aspartokinase [Thermodesulfobacterium commune]AIH04260.1 aspartate kinase [Thermodesulfobacterium commune DSM 2178]KUK37588.1 MAG: Aspartokinase [Thermodesulfobacterium commune]MBZ4682529.1 aspartate kinase [Thermodesulfobacterium sp.]
MLIVQKYGGTSVANIERIKKVAERVIKYKKEGHDLVVVVSAMAGETDRLINLAKEITPNPPLRELDLLVSTGEQVTSALLAITLQSMGFDSVAFLGYQIPIYTTNLFTKAKIKEIKVDKIKKELNQGKIVVVAGFQGVTEEGDITTLGRGGSDTTAVALAAALKADLCEIYTDVEGVYTADPRVVSNARKLKKISYEEMLEMASSGAKVLEMRSVELAMIYKVNLVVKSSFTEAEGTLITEEDEEMEKVLVSGITYSRNEARISIYGVPDKPGIAAQIFSPIGEKGIIVDMIIQTVHPDNKADITFTVPRTDYSQALEIVKEVAKKLKAERVEGDDKIAKVSIVGAGMRTHSGVATKMFETLAKHGINIMMISTSEIKISCVIDEKYTELAVRALHEAFQLDQENIKEEKTFIKRPKKTK